MQAQNKSLPHLFNNRDSGKAGLAEEIHQKFANEGESWDNLCKSFSALVDDGVTLFFTFLDKPLLSKSEKAALKTHWNKFAKSAKSVLGIEAEKHK